MLREFGSRLCHDRRLGAFGDDGNLREIVLLRPPCLARTELHRGVSLPLVRIHLYILILTTIPRILNLFVLN